MESASIQNEVVRTFCTERGHQRRKTKRCWREAERGLNNADLGGGLIKKRVAREGEGRRGGYRTIIIYRAGDRAVFVYGFPKSAKANLKAAELDAYQKLAQIYLSFSAADLAKAVSAGELVEVIYNGEEISE